VEDFRIWDRNTGIYANVRVIGTVRGNGLAKGAFFSHQNIRLANSADRKVSHYISESIWQSAPKCWQMLVLHWTSRKFRPPSNQLQVAMTIEGLSDRLSTETDQPKP
jgi:hypothetical protein